MNTGLIEAGDVIRVVPIEQIIEYKELGGQTLGLDKVRCKMKDLYEVDAVSSDGTIRTVSNNYQHRYIPEELVELVCKAQKQ